MGYRYLLIFIVVFVSFLLIGCKEHAHDERLEQIDVRISTDPEAAIVALDSIERSALSKSDRHYYDFLTIKANDKAYVRHTSDSLYLSVLDYYNRRKKDPLYPEVLYYGGRVYSDLGDYPTALSYYQNAIDILQEKENKELLRNAYSQTGVLLERLRLYNQAIPYLENSIAITREMKDSSNFSRTLQVMGSVYKSLKNYNKSKTYLKESLRNARHLPEEDKNYLKGYLATVYYETDENDSALNLIRGIPDKVKSIYKYYFNLNAARIYLKEGITDSALFFVYKVLESPNANYRMTAYRMLLYPEFRKYVPEDSISSYVSRFVRAGEKYYNSYDAESINIQNAFYNYSQYERKNVELLKSKLKLSYWLTFAILIVLILLFVIIFYRWNLKVKKHRLDEALKTIRRLNEKLDNLQLNKGFIERDKMSLKDVRNSITDEILSLKEKILNEPQKSNKYIYTEAYQKIQELLQSNKILIENSPLWISIQKTIKESSPEFEETLRRLSGNQLIKDDYRMAFLLRLGFNYSQISKLLGRVKGTMTYRSKRLSSKLFYGLVSNDELSIIIRGL